MYNFDILSQINKNIFKFFFNFLLVVYFYKLYFEYSIPITGDELNSILVYSSNIKTLFLKNFPHNAVFFHLIGFIKSIIFNFELYSFRIITFIFIILHFYIIKKLNYDELRLSLFFILILSSSFSLYGGMYIGYIFSSSIFVTIFYLIHSNNDNNKLIFFLLFIQTYTHLVNIYLVIPILLVMMITSNKKKFLLNAIFYFGIPLSIFYSFSIILSGLSVLKISDISISGVLEFIFKNYENIIIKGFNTIFFSPYISEGKEFTLVESLKEILFFDKFIFLILVSTFLAIIINLLYKKNLILTYILIIHFLLFVIINKHPPPRIFTGFFCFYILYSLTLLENIRYEKFIQLIKYFCIVLLLFTMAKFNYKKIHGNSKKHVDANYEENIITLKILSEKCDLINENFSEMQKKNYYFNYLNICDKKFNLSKFLKYYRS